MKTLLFTLLGTAILLFFVVADVVAQTPATHPITVQRTNGTSDYYIDINQAFASLTEGSTVYIPEGHYVLSSADSVKIKCRVSIYGVGSRYTEAMQLITTIQGKINFESGSSGSVMSGVNSLADVSVASKVNNILIKNISTSGNVNFGSENFGCVISGSIIKQIIYSKKSPTSVYNCIVGNIIGVNGGVISNCILVPSILVFPHPPRTPYRNYFVAIDKYDHVSNTSSNCIITNTIGLDIDRYAMNDNNQYASNMLGSNYQQVAYPAGGLADLFVKYDSNNPFDLTQNDYRLKDGAPGKNAGLDGKDIGIYGGEGFDDAGGSLIPRVVFKEIAPTTNADGKLSVKIKVTAN